MPTDIPRLRAAAAGLLLDWARQAAPHYGPGGSMDLDLRDTDDARGPSYYNQFAHYAFLLLAEGVVPGAAPDERPRFRAIAVAAVDAALRRGRGRPAAAAGTQHRGGNAAARGPFDERFSAAGPAEFPGNHAT